MFDMFDFTRGNSPGDIQEMLFQALGLDEKLEKAAREAVDNGETDCSCGKEDCLVGKAIRAEVKRRREKDETDPTVSVYMKLRTQIRQDLTTAIHEGTQQVDYEQLTKAVANGVYNALDNYRKTSLPYRLMRAVGVVLVVLFAVVAFVLMPFVHALIALPGFLYAAFRRDTVRDMGAATLIRKMKKDLQGLPDYLVSEILGQVSKHQLRRDGFGFLPFYLRWGVRFGDWAHTGLHRMQWKRRDFYWWRVSKAEWISERWQESRLYKWLNSRKNNN